jgi:mono/diheme cytochrome c family protein
MRTEFRYRLPPAQTENHVERPAIILFAFAQVLLAVGCGTKDPGDSSTTTAPDDPDQDDGGDGDAVPGDPVNGEAVYATSCSACHGASGEGGTGPAMSTVVPGLSASALKSVAMDGIGGMPPILSSEIDAEDVAVYCIETWGP